MPEYIQWKAHEHAYKEHSVNWFWGVGAIAIGAAILAIVFGNLLLALLIIVATAALLLQAVKKPKEITFRIDDAGVHVGATLHPYQNLDSFAVTDEHIFLKSKKRLMPYLVIPMPENEKEQDTMYDWLTQILPEEEMEEPVAEKIMDQLGF